MDSTGMLRTQIIELHLAHQRLDQRPRDFGNRAGIPLPRKVVVQIRGINVCVEDLFRKQRQLAPFAKIGILSKVLAFKDERALEPRHVLIFDKRPGKSSSRDPIVQLGPRVRRARRAGPPMCKFTTTRNTLRTKPTHGKTTSASAASTRLR